MLHCLRPRIGKAGFCGGLNFLHVSGQLKCLWQAAEEIETAEACLRVSSMQRSHMHDHAVALCCVEVLVAFATLSWPTAWAGEGASLVVGSTFCSCQLSACALLA